MSLFSTILEKLGITHTAPTQNNSNSANSSDTGQVASNSQAQAPVQAASNVDVAAKLDGMASQNSEKLNWKNSIVDLLKLLNIDSSLNNRKELAKELNYSGSTDDSAAMNIWLHKAVLTKLSQNGGNVPAELL